MMTIFLASLAGIPPLGGWFGKFAAFKALLDAGRRCGLHARRDRRRQHGIAAAYYVRVMREMWMKPAARRRRTPIRVAAVARGGARHHAAARSCSASCRASDALRRPPGPDRRPRRVMQPAGGRRRPRRIDAAGGPIPFDDVRELALYGAARLLHRPVAGGRPPRRLPHLAGGRPAVRRRRGPRPRRRWDGWADPTRSPSSTPAPARARWRAPVLAAARPARDALRYVRSSCSAAQRARHPAGVELGRRRCPADPIDGVVLANELLDNLPFRLAVHDGGWREAYVVAGAGRCASPRSCRAVRPGAGRAAGARRPRRRVPLQDAAAAWVAERARASQRRGWSWSSTTPAPRRPRWPRSTVARLAAHLPRPRARRPPPRRPGRPGHHRRGRRRPAARPDAVRSQAAVPAALGHRRARRRGPAGVAAAAATPDRRRAARCAAACARPSCAARPGRSRRVHAVQWIAPIS